MQQHAQLRFLAISAIILAMVFEISAHSQMRCAKYDPASGKCFAPIRNQVESFLTEAYSWYNGAPVCQSPMGNLITDSYANGPSCPDYAGCPDQMGVYRPSETFTVMWYARNHAVDNQAPGTVSLYLSPNEANNQGRDVAQGAFTKFCEGPFMNCGGVNQDTTPCTLTCTMPSKLSSGIYTLWWKWDWQGGAKYSTCADISVIATNTQSTTGPATPSTTGPSTTAAPVIPSTTGPSTTGVPKPSTTGVPAPATTGVPKPSTTGVPAPATTGPSTTGAPKPSTTGAPKPSTTGSPSTPFTSTCANVALVSSNSQATILSVDTWGAGSSGMFRAVVTVKASESVLTDWLLQFVFPSNAGNAKVNSVVNAGSKLCESSSPVLHDMIQPVGWSKQIASGEYVTIEIMGTNPAGLSKSDLQSNSAVTVFRRS